MSHCVYVDESLCRTDRQNGHRQPTHQETPAHPGHCFGRLVVPGCSPTNSFGSDRCGKVVVVVVVDVVVVVVVVVTENILVPLLILRRKLVVTHLAYRVRKGRTTKAAEDAGIPRYAVSAVQGSFSILWIGLTFYSFHGT